MNSSGKNLNGWILCPSKTFPGKFYYFNVANGETAWSLNECEKKSMKNAKIQKIGNHHCYPEPSIPPVGNTSPHTKTRGVQSNTNTQNLENNVHKNHTNNSVDDTPPSTITEPVQPKISFVRNVGNDSEVNHANNTYPKDVSRTFSSNNFLPNVTTIIQFNQEYTKLSLPIQIQLPTIVGSDYSHQNNVSQVVMLVLNPCPQNNKFSIEAPKLPLNIPAQMSVVPDRDLFIQTQNSSLSQRFVNFERPDMEFERNKTDTQLFHQIYDTSTPNKPIPPSFCQDQSIINSSDIFNNQSQGFEKEQSNLIPKPNLDFPQKPSDNIDSNRVIEKSTLKHLSNEEISVNPIKNIQILSLESKAPSNISISKENSTLNRGIKDDTALNDAVHFNDLDENDLRRVLMTKKRKGKDEDTNSGGKKVKTSKQDDCRTRIPKKTVTFNLGSDSMSDVMSSEKFSYDENATYNDMECIEPRVMQELKNLALPSKKNHIWYVVIDTFVLIEELQFLDSTVKLDPSCHLLIPSRVVSETEALSRPESQNRHHMTLARNVLRRLATSQPHIDVLPSNVEDSYNTTTESILNCCKEVMEQRFHVVLITNNKDLQVKAESLQIHCFNTDQVKNGTLRKSKTSFDIKNVKICINNVPENVEVETEISKNHFDDTVESTNMNLRDISNASLDFPFSTNDILKADKSGKKCNATMNLGELLNLNEKLQQRKYDATSRSRLESQTTSKNISNVPNTNETVSIFFQNKKSELNVCNDKNSELSPTVSPYFQNERNKEQRIPSIFENANDKLKKNYPQNRSIFETQNSQNVPKTVQPKSSIFEIDGIEKLETFQSKSPISKHKTTHKPNEKPKPSIFEIDYLKNIPIKSPEFDTYKLKQVQSNNSLSEIEKCKNRQDQTIPSIFEIDECVLPVLPSEIKNEDLEEFVETFYLENKIEDARIEQKKEEIICSFVQIMEDCLSDILKRSFSILKITPPWALKDALQCMVQVYGDHSTVRSAANILSVLRPDKEIKTKDVVKMIGCGLVLVRYMKDMLPNLLSLEDAEESLNKVLKSLVERNVDLDLVYRAPIVHTDLVGEEFKHKHRDNSITNRSAVVNYLKKHFTSWANYDESLEDVQSKSPGQKYTNLKIVRTCGKNLGMLKINNSKTLTMNEPTENVPENTKQMINNGDDNNNENEKADHKDISTIPKNKHAILSKIQKEYHSDSKLIRAVEDNPKISVQNSDKTKGNKIDDTNHESDSNIDKNQKNDATNTEPKIIRLFNNIKLTNDKSAKTDKKSSICNTDYAHGHTLGTDDKNCPKVVRNIKLIEKFEEKLNFHRKPLDLDKIDYSNISESDKEDNRCSPEKDCLSINLNDSDTKDLFNHSDATNDGIESSKNEKKNNTTCVRKNNNSYVTSLDNYVSNDIYATNDKESENYVTNDNHFSSDHISCVTNIASYGTDECYANGNGQNYVDMKTKHDSYAGNDEYAKVTQKDDTINDSGYENESLQAYSIVKTFLNELNASFTVVHRFIERSLHECRNGTLLDSKRRILQLKASAARAQIAKIISKLKCIILREMSGGTTLKVLMAGADDLVKKDEHIGRYRHVVSQCLKQAQILDRALKIMVSVTDSTS